MARLLFLSSVVCSFCFLATLVRCRQITGAPSESARSKNEPMPLQRVHERSYRDELFRPTRVRVRRAAASSSDKTQVVGEVLPNSESTLIETHAIADPPPPPPATTTPPSQGFLTNIATFPPAVAGIILLNEATAPQPPPVTTPPPPLHPAAAAATLLPVAANTLRTVSTTKSTTSTTSTNTTTIPHPAAATTPPPLRLATTPPISPATTPPPPLPPHPPADRAGKVKSGTNYAVLKESPAKEFPFAVEARLMSNSAYAALPGAVVPGAALPSAIASGSVVQSAVGPGAAVPGAGAVVAAYDVATPADTAAEELGKYRKVLPTKKPVRGASKQVLWPDSSAPVAPVAPAAPVAPVAPVATVAPAGKRVMSVNNPSGPVLYRNPVDSQLCAINPCKNDGICKIQPFGTSKIFCRCLPGFFGEYCQYDAPECQMDPCLNHGACHRSMSQPRGYECHCAYGYEGDNCEIAKVTAVAGGLLLADVVSDSFDSTASSDLTTTSAGPVVAPAAAAALTNRSLFVQMPFLAMVSVCALLLTLALYATIDTERKIVLERYTVLRAHGYDVEYPSAGYFGLALKKFVCLCCICCACCPCFDAMYLKVTEEQEPLPVLMKTGNIKGYTAVPQGYTAVPQGYTEVPQGYTAVPQGYTAVPQGYTAMPQGYIAVPQSGDGVSSP